MLHLLIVLLDIDLSFSLTIITGLDYIITSLDFIYLFPFQQRVLKCPGPGGFCLNDGLVNSLTIVFLGKFGYI